MSHRLRNLVVACFATLFVFGLHAAPLRVFIRAGVKTHGPNQHDHPRFLGEWAKLLGERGLTASGAMDFPTAAQLDATDVVVIFAADGMKIVGEERARFEKFLQRGGGLVVLHDGVVSGDQNEWAKKVQGGSWRWDGEKKTQWHEGEVGLYFVDQEHPITKGVSNFDWKDEVYNQMDMSPDVHVLATSFVDVFSIWPQLWTYEKTWDGGTAPYRAFVSSPGHEFDVFNSPTYRAILMRGIAWAGKRANTDEFCKPEELASLTYPAGGPKPANEAVKTLQLHPEFNVTLAADEHVAEKIMSLDWDPQGRLWVVETPEYPGGLDVNKNDFKAYWNRVNDPANFPVGGKQPRKPKDRISMLEDTNGEGVMDKKTVFADGLQLPTSLVFYKDGVIVSQAPDILWIRDTDHDGKADKIEVLYTGWGTFDTHAVVNNLRWGPDGWVYGTVGYTRGHLKSGDGKKDFGDIAAGVYRFRPDGSIIEQIAAGGCNTWGCEVAPDGEIVFTTATCGEPICHVVIPEKILARGQVGGMKAFLNIIEENKIYPAFDEKRQPYVQIDWVGAWTAAAGATIYDGGAWPAKWAPEDRYSFFMGEATRQLFHHEFLDPKGATYQGRKEESRKQTEFLASTDYWFRPIHSRVGPDGAIYVVDFYNQIAVHNDTRGPAHGARNAATRPDRDHHFTRLWRVQHKDAKKLPPFQFDAKNPAGLVKMLEHPNGWVRLTANRLLNETQPAAATPALIKEMKSGPTKYARIQSLHALNNLGRLDDSLLLAALKDGDSAVRKNAARLAGERDTVSAANRQAIQALLNDADGRAKIDALMALGGLPADRETADAVVAVWPGLKGDKWLESAAVGAAAKDPVLYLQAALGAKDPAFLAGFVPHLARLVANKGDAASAAKFVALLASAPASADGLKQAALDSFTANLKSGSAPAWDDALAASLKSLLASDRTAGSVLPLVARWDSEGKLAAAVKPAVSKAEAQLADKSVSDDVRGQVAANLIGVRKLDAGIVPAVASLLGGDASPALQTKVVNALGLAVDSAAAIVAAFPKLATEVIEPAFGQVVKRGETASALLDLLAAKQLDLMKLGPARQHRLRTHPDATVAKRANTVIDGLKGPEAKQKDELLAKLTPEVVKPGNLENGHKLFTANCAGCHVYKTEGRNLAPNLTGMGAHGPADLLVHIVDPNRQVEPNFVSTTIETKDDQSYDGIIERENRNEVVLRNATGDYTLRTADIKTRSSTGRSLMPEGFEQLGAEGLRDLLTFICADENRFRILDLTGAFTANNSRGLFMSQENENETVSFRSYNLKRVDDIPFDVISPLKSVANVVVLRGGAREAWSKKNLPQKVEVKVGVAAGKLHFLGGTAGWGYPYINDDKMPAAKVTLHFAGGATQEIVLRNGQEFADYVGQIDVPGSKGLPQFVKQGQVRWFSKAVTNPAVIETLTLESYDNMLAPMFFAITAETGAPASAPRAEAVPAKPELKWTAGLKTLLIGGGASHDYERWFNLADVAMLNGSGKISANYLEPQDVSVASVQAADVLLISANKAFPDPAVREAIHAHVNAGKGLVLLHPGLWYNWADWPAYNRELAGGGSRGHNRYGEFEVSATGTAHPVMTGVPAKFTISDELYYFEPDAQGTPIKVLATAHSEPKNKTFPQVFIVEHPRTRIVGITLGHDGVAHSLPAYQQLLKNAIYWSAKKDGFITADAK
jgi:putative membrane-bound dehydrogenase-like protein